jgi:hypothetical protein
VAKTIKTTTAKVQAARPGAMANRDIPKRKKGRRLSTLATVPRRSRETQIQLRLRERLSPKNTIPQVRTKALRVRAGAPPITSRRRTMIINMEIDHRERTVRAAKTRSIRTTNPQVVRVATILQTAAGAPRSSNHRPKGLPVGPWATHQNMEVLMETLKAAHLTGKLTVRP